MAGFRQGLGEAGYVDGRNATIEFRWAEARPDRLSALTADLAGGNLTGVTSLFNVLVSKRLQVLHEMVPTARAVGVLVNPNNPNAVSAIRDAAGGRGHRVTQRALAFGALVACVGLGGFP